MAALTGKPCCERQSAVAAAEQQIARLSAVRGAGVAEAFSLPDCLILFANLQLFIEILDQVEREKYNGSD